MHARRCSQRGCADPTVTVLGMTFKENVPDIRNSKVIDIVRELEAVPASRVQVHDPLAMPDRDAAGIRRCAHAARGVDSRPTP